MINHAQYNVPYRRFNFSAMQPAECWTEMQTKYEIDLFECSIEKKTDTKHASSRLCNSLLCQINNWSINTTTQSNTHRFFRFSFIFLLLALRYQIIIIIGNETCAIKLYINVHGTCIIIGTKRERFGTKSNASGWEYNSSQRISKGYDLRVSERRNAK